jgi:hypothetical protein
MPEFYGPLHSLPFSKWLQFASYRPQTAEWLARKAGREHWIFDGVSEGKKVMLKIKNGELDGGNSCL